MQESGTDTSFYSAARVLTEVMSGAGFNNEAHFKIK